MEDHNAVLERARGLGEQNHPDAPAEHHAAFANSVAYGVTGWSGGYGGPSMREHWASRLMHQEGIPGSITFDRAVKIVEDACYGPLTVEIAQMLVCEDCFDDPSGEQKKAMNLLREANINPEDWA